MSGFFMPSPLAIGTAIPGAVAEDIFFGGAGGTLAQDDQLAMKLVAGSRNVRMGGTITFDARLTLKGDDNTGNIMQWYFGGKGVLMSCNGLSVTNTTIPFHINLSGTTQGFAIQNDSDPAYPCLEVVTATASRTSPVILATGGTTPGAAADLYAGRNAALTLVYRVDNAGGVLATNLTSSALTATRIPFAGVAGLLSDSANFVRTLIAGTDAISLNGASGLAAMNLFQSGVGYFLMINNTTHYSNNKINFAGDFSMETDSLAIIGRLSERQGPDLSSANNLVLGSGAGSGNYYVVNGDVQVNLLSKVGWVNGSRVTLHLVPTASLTIKDDQATSGNNTKIKLTTGDLVAVAPQNLTLRLSTVGGVQAWRQEGPILLVA